MATKNAAEKDAEKKATAAIAIPDVTDEMLRGVGSVEDAIRLATELYGVAPESAADHLGNGFMMVEDKDHLLNRPMVILATKTHLGDWGEFCSVFAVMGDNNDRVIFNDGSTGIFYNVRELVERTGRVGGWIVGHGLRKSEYPTCGQCGKPRGTAIDKCETCGDSTEKRGKGVTYYLDAA